MPAPVIRVCVQPGDFNPLELQRDLLAEDAGAVVTFTGYVRAGGVAASGAVAEAVTAIELEHYPGMTERSIEAIIAEAAARWALKAVTVMHRIGYLPVGEQIVWVGASATHRGDAFAACEFVMDYLKTRAPFWKREFGAFGERWVAARDSDQARAVRWDASPE